MKFCANCGGNLIEGAKFCTACGHTTKFSSESEKSDVEVMEAWSREARFEESLGAVEESEPVVTAKDAAELWTANTTTRKKPSLIILGILLLLAGMAFFFWNSSAKEPEMWRTNAAEDYDFTIDVIIDKEHFHAKAKSKFQDEMHALGLDYSLIGEGELLPTENPNSQLLLLDTIAVELSDQYATDWLFSMTNAFNNTWDDGEFALNLFYEPIEQKKSLLAQHVANEFETFKNKYSHTVTESQLISLSKIESYMLETIDSLYEIEGGIGFKVAPAELKDWFAQLPNIDDAFFYDSQEIVAMLHAIENTLTFNYTNETSARVDIPIINERLFFKKEVEYP